MLYAGVGRADITPEMGTCLFGYRPGVESREIHDRIRVSAVLFRQGGKALLLISAEVALIENCLTERLRRLCGEICGIEPWQVVISSTHTHSAPNVAGMSDGWGELDVEYCESIFVPAVCRAAEQANASSVAVSMGVGETESRVGVNRRQIFPSSYIDFGQNPWGPYDPRMTVLSFVNSDTGEQVVNIVHYGCHGTAAGCNHEVTRDWSGAMLDALEQKYGGMAMFVNGAEGDVGPRISNGRTTGDISYVEELGEIAAADGLRARDGVTEHVADPALKLLCENISLDYRPLESREELQARLDRFLVRFPEPDKLENIERMEYCHIVRMLRMHDDGTPAAEKWNYLQTVASIGDIAIVPFPFEMFSVIAMRLDNYSPYRRTLCLSNSNGSNVYLPCREDICRGGYEVATFRFGNGQGLSDDSDTRIIQQDLALVQKLYGQTEK